MYRFLIHNLKKMVGEIAQKETNLCQNRFVDYKIKMRVANCDMKLQIQFSSFKQRSTRAISFVNKFKENGHIVTQNQDVTHHSLVVFKKITKGPPEQEFVYYCETVPKSDCTFLLRVEGTYRTRYQNLDLYIFVQEGNFKDFGALLYRILQFGTCYSFGMDNSNGFLKYMELEVSKCIH